MIAFFPELFFVIVAYAQILRANIGELFPKCKETLSVRVHEKNFFFCWSIEWQHAFARPVTCNCFSI